MNAPAVIPEPAARVPNTATKAALSATAANAAIAVADREREEPEPDFRVVIPGRPQVPCASVAIASRARYAHMPAINCATLPNIAANGASASGDFGVPTSRQTQRLSARRLCACHHLFPPVYVSPYDMFKRRPQKAGGKRGREAHRALAGRPPAP